MKNPFKSELRANHFVPQFWLAGFTEDGNKDGRLWVTDLKRQKQWPSSPAEAGHRRDFYRVSDPELDPVGAEKLLSKIEDATAPTIKKLATELRGPADDELDTLFLFLATQWMRVPKFRPTILGVADSIHRTILSKALETPESWAEMLKSLGFPANSLDEYKRMRDFEESGNFSLSAETGWYLLRGFESINPIISSLRGRWWGASISRKGSFIGSDNPVAMDGTRGVKVGFKNAEIVTCPISRRVVLYGTKVRVRAPFVNQMYIAHTNTFTMLSADEQIYSATPDFCWLDETGGYQTDWKRFSKSSFE